MDMIVALLVLLSISFGSRSSESCIIAQYDERTTNRQLECTFSVSDVPNTTDCDTTLRQVFRLLDVNDDYVLIGSTECLYALTPDLKYDASLSISQPGSSVCHTAGYGEKTDFICQNYISNWFDDASDPTSFQVCGTYDAANPRCWSCNKSSSDLSCDVDTGTEIENMPTDPIVNVTAIMTEDGLEYFIGGLKNMLRISGQEEFQIGRVVTSTGSEDIVTADNADQVMYSPVDFVGEPIEHGNFIYFFFRERALENHLQQIIYSRVARVCKNDAGGATNPLREMFTTYLKARLMCSCGDDFPMIYNEIQDIHAVSQGSDTVIYGLFTTPNTKASSSSAICRYSLTEIEMLFNDDNRRGPSEDNINIDDTKMWSQRSEYSGDSSSTRETCGEYNQDMSLYRHLLNFPLLNTNVPNCGLGRIGDCNNGARVSHNALAVFHKIRGQQFTVSESTEENIEVYIGTNNGEVLEVYIDTLRADIAEVITLRPEEMSADDINDKWPYGISSLRTHNGVVYGNMDSCLFRFPPYPCRNINGLVFERRDSKLSNHTQRIPNHTQRIPDAVTDFSTVFDAPFATIMVPHFSGLFNDSICSWKRFDSSANGKEVLHVFCEISTTHITNTEGNVCSGSTANSTLKGMITIVSGESCMTLDNQPVFEVNIDIDCSVGKDLSEAEMEEVMTFDMLMAEYQYNLNRWFRSDTCPSAAGCCHP